MNQPHGTAALSEAIAVKFMSSKSLNQHPTDENSVDIITIQSRFGEVSADLNKAIFFPHGLLGLPEKLHFVVTDMPHQDMQQFKLLQCVNDHALSFVVLALDYNNVFINQEDVKTTCETLNIQPENLLMMLIVTAQRSPSGTRVSANVRAPIVIDIQDKAAIQFVFPHNKYSITQSLSEQ